MSWLRFPAGDARIAAYILKKPQGRVHKTSDIAEDDRPFDFTPPRRLPGESLEKARARMRKPATKGL